MDHTLKRGRLKRFLPKLLLIVFGLFVGCVIVEIALRVANFSFPEFYQPDASRGYALRPGIQGWYRKEGEAYVEINSDGLRDREHTKEKPANTLRIAVLGDSYPEAFQVAKEQAFWSVMEQKLQQCGAFGGKKIEVINFGVSGYGTAQELITLRERVWEYEPDMVMLTITTNNDISDNSRALKKTDQIPYFVVRNGELQLDDSFRQSKSFAWRLSPISRFGRWIKDNSRLVQAVNQAHYGFKILLASWESRMKADDARKTDAAPKQEEVLAKSEELGTDNVVYLEPGNAIWNEAWDVTERLMVTMNNEVKGRGARFVVVTSSNGPQVWPDPSVREVLMRRFGVKDLFYPDNRIKALGEREKMTVITLAPELQAYAEKNRTFLHGFGSNIGNGHWNVEGHRVVGELLAEKLCTGAVPW
jgi:lysophospholipase L1-like esterase